MTMQNIGVIGTGFVGTAVVDGMRHAFAVHSYDKKLGSFLSERRSTVRLDYRNVQELVEGVGGHPVFVCVPTPMNGDGSCDTSIVEGVVAEIAAANRDLVAVIKSTVPPGTTKKLAEKYQLDIVFNPEFLTERNALEDFKRQDRIVAGGTWRGLEVVREVYRKSYPEVTFVAMESTAAEMVKYVANCFLATKVSFANEMRQVCDRLNVSYEDVISAATLDKRLGKSHWKVPGPDGKLGFGLTCFPKDMNAMMKLADDLGVNAKVLRAAWEKNLEVRPERDWEMLKGRAVS